MGYDALREETTSSDCTLTVDEKWIRPKLSKDKTKIRVAAVSAICESTKSANACRLGLVGGNDFLITSVLEANTEYGLGKYNLCGGYHWHLCCKGDNGDCAKATDPC